MNKTVATTFSEKGHVAWTNRSHDITVIFKGSDVIYSITQQIKQPDDIIQQESPSLGENQRNATSSTQAKEWVMPPI